MRWGAVMSALAELGGQSWNSCANALVHRLIANA